MRTPLQEWGEGRPHRTQAPALAMQTRARAVPVCRRELVQLCVQVVAWRRWTPVHATLLPQVQVAAQRIHSDVGAVVATYLGLGRPKDLGVLSARNVEPLGARGRPACPGGHDQAVPHPSHPTCRPHVHRAQAHARAWPQATCWRGPRSSAS